MLEEKEKQPYTLPPIDQSLTEDDVRRIVGDMLANLDRPAKISGSFIQSANFITGVQGWQLRADGAEINGGVSVTSINIPDTTTANSFHVDSSGNAWWGTNVATGYSTANAYILSTGAAHFENVEIGGTTIQYVITNSGIFSFGDGSDGDATCDGSTAVTGMSRSGSTYTMTRDVYFNNLTINSSVTVKPVGYRIFVKNTLTVNGTIQRNGENATNGANGQVSNSAVAGGAGGGVLADGYLKGSLAGKDGGAGSNTSAVVKNAGDGVSGSNTTNSLGSNGVAGGAGGNGGDGGAQSGAGGSASSGGTVTTSNVKLIANWHLATLLDISSTGSTVKFDNSASSGSGGGGGEGGGSVLGGACQQGGGGGGSGSSGGIVAIYARSIIISATGLITANGGNGGNGGNGASGNGSFGAGQGSGGGGGGGGGGGNGGIIVLTYNSLSNGGSITVTAGTKGTGGTGGTAGSEGGGNGANGSDGTNGSAGVIYQFQLSL